MPRLDNLDRLFVGWAFFFQIALIIHFAFRRSLFEAYTLKYGWIVYALCIPGLVVSLLLLRGGKPWSFWIGGFIFLLFSMFGYWVDYVAEIQFRSPFQPMVGVPYVVLYLATVMFYWWPIGLLSRPLWLAYAVLFVIATVLNISSH
jgi:hypothetical protein